MCFCHSFSLKGWRKTLLAVYKSVTLADLCEFFFSFPVFFEEDWIANCSQVIQRHDVETLGRFMSLAQTATRQRAEHEKWRDCIYPAYSTQHMPIFFALSMETNNNSQRKTLLGMKGKTETLHDLKYSSSTSDYFS